MGERFAACCGGRVGAQPLAVFHQIAFRFAATSVLRTGCRVVGRKSAAMKPNCIHTKSKKSWDLTTNSDSPIPFRERICCSIPEACLVGGFGRTTIYSLISSGRIKTVKVGRRTLINVRSLLALLEPADEVDRAVD